MCPPQLGLNYIRLVLACISNLAMGLLGVTDKEMETQYIVVSQTGPKVSNSVMIVESVRAKKAYDWRL